jgi:hypothetical protein
MWWELRRIPYNLTLLVSGIISILCMSFVVNGAGDFISGLAIMGFAFLANFFYSFGWVTELLLRLFSRRKATWFGLKSFKIGFIIAICGTFVPPLAFGIAGLIKGEKFSSPYSHFTTTEPKRSDIVGEYKLSDLSKKQLNFPDSINNKTIIRFNADSSFDFQNFPECNGMEMSDYRIKNSTGKWKLENDNGHWVIPMNYEVSTDIKSNTTDSSGMYYYNSYNVSNNKPPYDIYIIIGDPDSWYGVTLQKK